MAFSKTLKEKRLIIQCDSCFKEVTLKTFVRCAECRWDQCLACFFANIETLVHKKAHSYRVVSNLSQPLFYEDWRVIDELLLVNGVITFGIGNFEDIATILSPKSEIEVKNHFFRIFGIVNNEEGECYRTDVQRSDPNDTIVLSYMPRRRDFESEILNDYEMTINSLQYSDADSELETKFKKHMLDHYKVVLKQRCMWKTYVLDRNFVDINRLKAMDAGETGPLIGRYKWLVQYLSKNDFNRFIGGLVKEKRLREKKGKKVPDQIIDESRLLDVTGLLGPKEKELCRRLSISYHLYANLKRLSIECYIARKPLKNLLFSLFDRSEQARIGVLYRWFKNQNTVHLEEKPDS